MYILFHVSFKDEHNILDSTVIDEFVGLFLFFVEEIRLMFLWLLIKLTVFIRCFK